MHSFFKILYNKRPLKELSKIVLTFTNVCAIINIVII
jgi:hypothetical protein